MLREEKMFGIKLTPLTIQGAVFQIRKWLKERSTCFVSVSSVNNVVSAYWDRKIKQIQNSTDMTTTDGMPLVWALKLKGYREIERICGSDLMPAVLEMAEKEGYSNYFYGGTNNCLKKLEYNLKKKFPKLKIAGSYSPPFKKLNEEENRWIIENIKQTNSRLIWVGLSTPKQEEWMYRNKKNLNDCVLIGVGAVFDFIAGNVRRAPYWMQMSGLEWLFRLMHEPRRLWKRYLIGNMVFLWLVLKELAK